jgi:hypothetical protein
MTSFLLACFLNGALQSSVHFANINDCNYYKRGLNNQEYIKGNEPQLYNCICKLVPSVDPNKVKVY